MRFFALNAEQNSFRQLISPEMLLQIHTLLDEMLDLFAPALSFNTFNRLNRR